MLPADARSASAAAARLPKYHTASTSPCSASTFASASFGPVTMLTTPPGRSEASSTVYNSVAASGCASEGIATTVLPVASAGATSDTNPSKGCSAGQAVPKTPIGSLDRKSTRLNSSHGYISYAVFCLEKKKKTLPTDYTTLAAQRTDR